MHRIDTDTADPDANGTGVPGFRDGVPPGTASTRLDADFFNALQEEIANTVEATGETLDKESHTQLLMAVRYGSKYASYTISGAAVAFNAKFTLTSDAISSDGFVLSSNQITVPENGIYLVSIGLYLKNAGTADPQSMALGVKVDGSSVNCDLVGWRASASAADPIQLSGTFLRAMYTTELLSLTNGSAGNADVPAGVSALSKISFAQLRRLT